MRNRSAPRYSCQAPLARVCTKPQGLFHGLSLPVEAAKHKHRLPTLESRSFNPPVQKGLSNCFSLNPLRERRQMFWKRVKYFSLELLFTRKIKEKEEVSRERARARRRNRDSALNIVFLHEGPHKGAGLIQREEEERMRYGKRKKKELQTVRKQCCLISLFWCCLSLHCQ